MESRGVHGLVRPRGKRCAHLFALRRAMQCDAQAGCSLDACTHVLAGARTSAIVLVAEMACKPISQRRSALSSHVRHSQCSSRAHASRAPWQHAMHIARAQHPWPHHPPCALCCGLRPAATSMPRTPRSSAPGAQLPGQDRGCAPPPLSRAACGPLPLPQHVGQALAAGLTAFGRRRPTPPAP
jgi:hypothetical protein